MRDLILITAPRLQADEVALYAFGSDGLEELKTKIDPSEIDQALVGFVRVDDLAIHPSAEEETEDEYVKYVLINYVPKGVLGVRRGEGTTFITPKMVPEDLYFLARAKVHSRRLGMIFKVSHTSLDHIDHLCVKL